MNETTPSNPSAEANKNNESERTKQVTAAVWMAGVFAVVAGGTLINAPIWPVAFGLAAMALMVAFVCSCILKRG